MRVAAPFPHQDPAVQPIAQFLAQACYLPSLDRALHASQDTDTALLGVISPARPGAGLSTARQLLREVVQSLHGFSRAAGGIR